MLKTQPETQRMARLAFMAGADDPLETLRQARFEEGVSVDVPKYLREHGNPEAAEDWVDMNEEHKDEFKKTAWGYENRYGIDPETFDRLRNRGYEAKDRWRIQDIAEKADGDRNKESNLARRMAQSITGIAKALRRAWAAEAENYHNIAAIFYDRAEYLGAGGYKLASEDDDEEDRLASLQSILDIDKRDGLTGEDMSSGLPGDPRDGRFQKDKPEDPKETLGKSAGNFGRLWKDMEGKPIDVGSYVGYWPTPRRMAWFGVIQGADFNKDLLLVGDPKDDTPLEIPFAEVSQKLRLYNGPYDTKGIVYPEDIKKPGKWNMVVYKSRPSRWEYFLTNPQGGGSGSGGWGSATATLRLGLQRVDFKGHDRVWVIIAVWDYEIPEYEGDNDQLSLGGGSQMAPHLGAYRVTKSFWLDVDKIAQARVATEDNMNDDLMARYEEGKPADPTKEMSPEDAAKWRSNTEEYGDKFKGKTADEDAVTFDNLMDYLLNSMEHTSSPRQAARELISHGYPIPFISELIREWYKERPDLTRPKPGQMALQVQEAASEALVKKIWDHPHLGRTGSDGSSTLPGDEKAGMFEKGKPADPTENMSPEDAAEWKKQKEEHKDEFKGASLEERWGYFIGAAVEEKPEPEKPEEKTDKTAATAPAGLYGYTKGVQADCESCVHRMEKAAQQIAKKAYSKDENVAPFLAAHAKRADSLPAKILVAALQNIGPKVASEEPEEKVEKKPEEKTAGRQYGLYGFMSKTATLGLTSCAQVRDIAGTLASGLHGRRADKHANVTGFLAEHAKQAKCMYSKLLHTSYPDSDRKVASTLPDTVAEWLTWED